MTALSMAVSIANRAADLQRQAIEARDIAVALEQENAEINKWASRAFQFILARQCDCGLPGKCFRCELIDSVPDAALSVDAANTRPATHSPPAKA